MHRAVVWLAVACVGLTAAGRNCRHRNPSSGATLKGHTHYVLGVVYSPDGKMLASGSADQSIRTVERGQR